MNKMVNHPLHSLECSLKRALVLSGFSLSDDARSPEVVPPEWDLPLAKFASTPPQAIKLEQGYFILRTNLLANQLEKWKAPLPLKMFAAGTLYDGNDQNRPDHRRIQGIWADGSVPTFAWLRVWDSVIREVFGLGASFNFAIETKDCRRVDVTVDGRTFALAHVARATGVTFGLLGLDPTKTAMWMFDIDIDSVACGFYGIENREELYSTRLPFLRQFEDSKLGYGSYFLDRACDLLRKRGFVNYYGSRFYEADCYQKMHMIQDGWDTNNDGMRLVDPIGSKVWLPTVLTPSLQEALSENARAGEESCYLFEVAHTILPYSDSMKDFRERNMNSKYDSEREPRKQTDKPPRESVTLAFGAYDDQLTEEKWTAIVSDFLDEFGIREHYYLDTARAIAYELTCKIVINDKMQMLGGNFGAIHPEARKNFGIDKPAFMANIAFEPLEREAAMEMIFVPIEYR